MEIIEKINSVPIKPRKIRFLVRQLKNKPILELKDQLVLVDQRVGVYLVKGLGSLINRIKLLSKEPDNFLVKRIICNEGIRLKRRMIDSRGRTRKYVKQRSNIVIVAQEIRK